MSFPIEIQYPSREKQLVWCRWGFVVSYLSIGAVFSGILIQVSADKIK